MKKANLEISVEKTFDDSNNIFFQIKIIDETYEINFEISEHEIPMLKKVLETDWESGSLAIGKSLGSKIFWSVSEDKKISLLIGEDDQTWEVGILLPLYSFNNMIKQIETY